MTLFPVGRTSKAYAASPATYSWGVPDALSLLYKVIDGRNRRSSTAVITNVSFDDWTEYLGDPPMTMALLDRVVDQTNLIKFEGESIRGEALRKLKKASVK